MSTSLETAKRIAAFYQEANDYDCLIGSEISGRLDDLNEEMPEPKP